jgi:hypothetical protein
MPKAADKLEVRKVKATKGKAASRKPTFTCACTGGCKGRTRELSEALYKKHAKFRELDEATDKGNLDDLASQQANSNIQHGRHGESVSYRLQFNATSLQFIFSVLSSCYRACAIGWGRSSIV